MVNFGPLTAEICWRVLGTPANFQGFCVLAELLHGSQVVSVSQTCGLEQRAPLMFSRATITSGIGPQPIIIIIIGGVVGDAPIVHYWADSQSVRGLRCYGNITRTRNVSEYMLVLALCLVSC